MKHTLALGVALACAVGLAGCNSSSGTSKPDLPFLQVTQTTPADNAVAVARNIEPQLTFSESLDVASVTAETVQLLGPGGAVPVTLTVTGSRLKLKPSAGLLPGQTTYTLRVGGELRARSGKKMETAAGTTFTFTTAAQTWSAAEALPGRVSSAHVLMVDDGGKALLVWPNSYNAMGHLQASVYQNGAWGEVGLAVPAISGTLSGVVGRALGNGSFVVAWEQSGGDDPGVFSATYSGNAWSEPQRLSAKAGYNLRMSSNRQGMAALVWLETVAANQRDLLVASYEAEGWQEPQKLLEATNVKELDVVIGGPGIGAVIWTQYDAASKRDQTRVAVVHEHVSYETALSRAGSAADMPTIVAEPDGRLTAAWLEAQPNQLYRLTVSRLDGENWSVPETLDADRTLFGRPLLLADADGRISILWNAVVQGGGGYVVSAVRREGTTWGTVSDIPGSGPNMMPYELSAVVDAGGQVTVAWQSVSENLYRVGYSRGVAGAWAQADWLGDGDGVNASDSNPRLGIDANGNITAAWGQMKVGQVTMRTRRYE